MRVMPTVISALNPSMKSSKSNWATLASLLPTMLTVGVAIGPSNARAMFDGAVSPPRFELKAGPGEVIRQSVAITNGATQPARYSVKTADWELDATGNVQYYEGAPGPSSCRPWLRVERHAISVGPQTNRNYRFEIHVPPDASAGECRFALLVSGDAATVKPGGSALQIPIVGRLGVIVYLAVGEAKPVLKLSKIGMRRTNGTTRPFATFSNAGNAHGRVTGALLARDATGRTVELVAEEAPILPGSTNTIALNPVRYASGEAATFSSDLVPPLHVRGKLQFMGGGEVSIDQVIREESPAKPRTRQAFKDEH